MEIGTSLSHPHARWLGLDSVELVSTAKSLGFSWIRLGCYWDEIQLTPHTFDFEILKRLLEACERHELKVVMTVGMKAPRWPEFHLPDWWETGNVTVIDEERLGEKRVADFWRYFETCIQELKSYQVIKVWQVENEPYDPSGPNKLKLSEAFVSKESEKLKLMDNSRQVMVTVWGNELGRRKVYKHAFDVSNIVGLDLYPKVPLPVPGLSKFINYVGPLDNKSKIATMCEELRKEGREVWIAELQAEPWESNDELWRSDNPPSFTADMFEKNWEWVKVIKPDVVLWWGLEYWMWREKQGDSRFLETIKKFIRATEHT